MRNVVHLAYTPIAGAPYRIVKALNLYSDYTANLITLNPFAYGKRVFPGDLSWNDNKEECIDIINKADIIHTHQYMDIRAAFGAEIAKVCNRKVCIRQWHSAPEHFSKDVKIQEKIIHEKIPQLVIAQYHSRYYPLATMVPNLVGIYNYQYKLPPLRRIPHIVCSPSNKNSSWDTRWDTKGYNEIKKILERLKRKGYCTFELVYDQSYEECLQKKQEADLIIDDLITGSYHLSGLEGLALGRPVLGFLDEQVERNLRQITGALQLPWVNVHLENAENVLIYLLENADLLRQLGLFSFDWVNKYYSDKILIRYYIQFYDNLLNKKIECQIREKDLAINSFYDKVLPDLLWNARKDRMNIRFYSIMKNLQHMFKL